MAAAEEVQFSLKVMTIKESCKVVYAEVDSDFADVLLSFLTLPLGTIMRLLIKHYGNNAPILGSLKSLYVGLQNLDSCHFWTEAGKLMLLNPRNSSEIQCSRLKLQIDNISPMKCFVCWNGTCASMYNKVMPNSPISLLRILKLNGIEDTNELEERTLIVGLKEMMELLKGSLVSKTPLTDIILGISTMADTFRNRKRFLMSAICEPNALRRTSMKINVKALVQYSTNRILLAQTRQDFIDFLFSLLTIPLGSVQFLLGNNTCFWSINNLYRSISNLEIGEHVKSKEIMTRLLEPQLPPYYLSSSQIFSLEQQSSPELYRLYNSNRVKLFVSTPIDIWHEMEMIDPKGKDCFVKGPTTFMVTDDLVASIPSSTSMISILNKMKIPLSDVEVRELDIGIEEALSILKASLISTRALTEGLKPFLKKEPNQ